MVDKKVMNKKMKRLKINAITIFLLLIANCSFSQSCLERYNTMAAL